MCKIQSPDYLIFRQILISFRITIIELQVQACNFIKKETLAKVFSLEFCEISKNTFFTECLQTTASVLWQDLKKLSELLLQKQKLWKMTLWKKILTKKVVQENYVFMFAHDNNKRSVANSNLQ